MNEEPTIELTPNGPYIIKNLSKLTNSNNEKFEEKQMQALCRCGTSKNKPFCDGSHVAMKFSDKKDRTETYETLEFEGKEITVVDNIGICSHAGACVKGAPKTFFSWEGEKRISNPDKEDKDTIINTIRKCPSGSLAYKLDGKLHDEYFSEPEIFIGKDGPLNVRGGIELKNRSNSELISKDHYALCRCGSSKNKPFCDGTHKKVGFKDE